MSVIQDDDRNESVHVMIHKLLAVLVTDEPAVGASAIVDLIISNWQSPKEQFLKDMSDAWDFYKNRNVRHG